MRLYPTGHVSLDFSGQKGVLVPKALNFNDANQASQGGYGAFVRDF